MKTKKPPLGVQPKYIWIEKRIVDLSLAIKRYLDAELTIPTEWLREYNSLVKKQNKREVENE